jgi:hypothetical protein
MCETATVVFLIGAGMGWLGVMFFRRPGVGLRVSGLATREFWRANRYLKPSGVALVIAGWVVVLIGGVCGGWRSSWANAAAGKVGGGDRAAPEESRGGYPVFPAPPT